MHDTSTERIEGLEPRELLRAALGHASDDPAAAEQAAAEERSVRAEIERRLPDLELLELLGRGGMGYVYRALQKKLGREVALKVVAPDAERQADFAERFTREAQALARLNHPNIVAVHDYGQDGPFSWLIMEYVDGSNLRDVIRAGKLEPAEALALIPKLCDALQFAHDRGVVHRDVKPENILLDGEGGVKIADFGLAKLMGAPAALVSLTGSQQVLGTFRYMAPEQLDRPLEVDHRADIYSLGVVFYEMLTNEIPMGRFDAPSLHSTASRAVDEVVLRALEKEPERRYQHAVDVKSDLESMGRTDPPPLADSDSDFEVTSSAPAPKLCVRAVVSPVLFGLSLFPFLMLIAVVLMSGSGSSSGIATSSSSSGSSARGLAPFLIMPFIGFIGLSLMISASVLGFRALAVIRSDWPRLYGVGAATVGAWAWILLFANAAFLFASLTLLSFFMESTAYIPMATALLLLVGDVLFLLWYRHQFLNGCRVESAIPPQLDQS